jgi:predicted nuclease with TOPRIM domain
MGMTALLERLALEIGRSKVNEAIAETERDEVRAALENARVEALSLESRLKTAFEERDALATRMQELEPPTAGPTPVLDGVPLKPKRRKR